jgi:hypothetical protein
VLAESLLQSIAFASTIPLRTGDPLAPRSLREALMSAVRHEAIHPRLPADYGMEPREQRIDAVTVVSESRDSPISALVLSGSPG